MDHREHVARCIVAFAAGGVAAIGMLVMFGETGGNFMRQSLEDERAAHAAYRQQCEETASRAAGATALAERVLQGR